MTRSALGRLLAPRSIALLGGVWADAAAAACGAVGYRGELWRVHPSRPSNAEQHYYRSVDELPAAPDATFIAAPAREVPGIAAALARRGAGGFVCFAAGFSEVGSAEGRQLDASLRASAAELPYFGPNCYGIINFFDRAALWPDQVVGAAPERGVALICQSGTIALNLLFNRRSLPIGYVLTVGNQARLAVEDLIEALAEDERTSAFGLYVEGVKDMERFARAVDKARAAGKPVALVKAGRTEAAARTAHSHTGSLAGSDAVFDAYCRQSGVARCDTLATLCETLKVLHTGGPLRGRRTLLMGASGGDMAMAADTARDLQLEFPPIPAAPTAALRTLLGEQVALANPLDFQTKIWFDRPRVNEFFGLTARAGYDVTGFMVDCPPSEEADAASYLAVIEEFQSATQGADTRAALISSLPESLPAPVRARCLATGIAPLQGQREALEALDLAAAVGEAWRLGAQVRLQLPRQQPTEHAATLSEHAGKAALAAYGVRIPQAQVVPAAAVPQAASALGFPVVIKASGASLEHKSDVGGVVLDVRTVQAAAAAAAQLAHLSEELLVEQMIADGVAEVLIGITRDPQFGQVLLLGTGGVMTEWLADTIVVLPPFSAESIERALRQLRVARLLKGFRGRPAGDLAALVDTALACTRYAQDHLERLVELDLNPVIVRPAGLGAVAVDALIRLTEES